MTDTEHSNALVQPSHFYYLCRLHTYLAVCGFLEKVQFKSHILECSNILIVSALPNSGISIKSKIAVLFVS